MEKAKIEVNQTIDPWLKEIEIKGGKPVPQLHHKNDCSM